MLHTPKVLSSLPLTSLSPNTTTLLTHKLWPFSVCWHACPSAALHTWIVRELQLTSLFDWYQTDFADNEKQLLHYVAQQRPDLAERITTVAKLKKPKIKYVYDWSLNKAHNR